MVLGIELGAGGGNVFPAKEESVNQDRGPVSRCVGVCVKEVRVVGTPEVGLSNVILSCVVGNH